MKLATVLLFALISAMVAWELGPGRDAELAIPARAPEPGHVPASAVAWSNALSSGLPARVLEAGLPLSFVENRGQWPGAARFVASRAGMSVGLEPDALHVAVRRYSKTQEASEVARVRLIFESARPGVVPHGEALQSGHRNYFRGEPARWRTGVPSYDSVSYPALYEGISLRVREGAGNVEYDLLLEPDADLDRFIVRCEGARGLSLDSDGSLLIETALGALRQAPPVSWYVLEDGAREQAPVRFRLLGGDRFGFDIAGERRLAALVIDPALEWSTFLGGSGGDFIQSVDVLDDGSVVVAGFTNNWDFPATEGAYDTSWEIHSDYWDAFVTRFAAGGDRLIYSTFLGGYWDDQAYGVHGQSDGSVTVGGLTKSEDFPTTPGAFDRSPPAGKVFVTRLSPLGDRLEFSTFIGQGWLKDLEIDTRGRTVLTGATYDPGFPTTPGAYDVTYNGNSYHGFGGDVYVTCLDETGSALHYSTFVGGARDDGAWALDLDENDNPVIAGWTVSFDFPTSPHAFDDTFFGDQQPDGFVAKLDARGSTLLYGTYLGGQDFDGARTVAAAAGGRIVAAGFTLSSDFPSTPGAFDPTFNPHGLNPWDGFVLSLDPARQGASQLVYSTFLGGSAEDHLWDVTLDPADGPIVCGYTLAVDFPVTSTAFDRSHNGGYDVFVSHLSPDGSRLVYSTFLGGSCPSREMANAIAIDPRTGAVVAAGETCSSDYPTTPGAFDTEKSPPSSQGFAAWDGIVTKLFVGPFLEVNGIPRSGTPFHFDIVAASVPSPGALAQVLISGAGTEGIPLPGGFVLPLTFDHCTAFSLALGGQLQASIDPVTGQGSTPPLLFTGLPPNRTVHCAALLWEPTTGEVLAVTPALTFTTQ